MATLEPIQDINQGSRQQWASRNMEQIARITPLQPISASSGKHNSYFDAPSTSCPTRRWGGCARRERMHCLSSLRASIHASLPRNMTRSSETHWHLFLSKQPTGFTPPGPIPLPLTPRLRVRWLFAQPSLTRLAPSRPGRTKTPPYTFFRSLAAAYAQARIVHPFVN